MDINIVAKINQAAVLVLLFYLVPVGAVSKRWVHKAPIIAASVVLALQLVDPVVDFIPDMSWPAVLFNVALALGITAWRKPLWDACKQEMA